MSAFGRDEARGLFSDLFRAAVAAADPHHAVQPHLPPRPKGRTVVIGAGKASAQMAAGLEEAWGEPLWGLVVTRYGYGCSTRNIEIIEAGHPLPDEMSIVAARRLEALLAPLTEDDLVIALISGGGSALLCALPPGFKLDDEIAVHQALLRSGAPIAAMNTIRKHLSRAKGGRLAAATRARVHTLVVSDVPGDAAHEVASGPTLPDLSSRTDALALVRQYGIALPEAAREWLSTPGSDCPSPTDPVFRAHSHAVVASAGLSLAAAARHARKLGLNALVLSDAVQGEARHVGQWHAEIAAHAARTDGSFPRPLVLLSGGETTVTMRGHGRGGRNSEFLLSFALGIDGLPNVRALAADTDGIDGSEQNAGVFADGETVNRLRGLGHDPVALLKRNDSHTAFALLDDLFTTGPTGTNVNDFRAILID